MSDELQEYLNLFFELENPVFFSLFLALVLFVFIIFVYKLIIAPLRKIHLIEKNELELKNIKLMALFAELDPNPLLRIDKKGIIIHSNDAAKELANISIDGKNIREIIPSINFSFKEYIEGDKSVVVSQTINKKFYSILFRGISYLNIAQIYFDDLTERKHFEEELNRSRGKLSELSGHLRDTLEDERQRIARELHDSIGGQLHFIRMKIENNGLSNAKGISEGDHKKLLNSVETSISELKEIINNLKPKVLHDMGLGLALKILVKNISVETGISGTINISGDETRLDKKLELALYRLSQEAINNIVKHSQAKEFNIQLLYGKIFTKLLISDDGVGFEPDKATKVKSDSGFGLLNMEERVKAYNGKLKIDSSPGSGTILIIEIPKNINEQQKNQNSYSR